VLELLALLLPLLVLFAVDEDDIDEEETGTEVEADLDEEDEATGVSLGGGGGGRGRGSGGNFLLGAPPTLLGVYISPIFCCCFVACKMLREGVEEGSENTLDEPLGRLGELVRLGVGSGRLTLVCMEAVDKLLLIGIGPTMEDGVVVLIILIGVEKIYD